MKLSVPPTLSANYKRSLSLDGFPSFGSSILSTFQSHAKVDATLLSYYVDRLCPASAAGSEHDSPFANLIIPLAYNATTPALLDSLMCLAASHRSRFDLDYHRTAARYAASALHHLQHVIKQTCFRNDDSTYAEILATVLLLCQAEISRSCNNTWVVHLKGARELVRQQRTQQGLRSWSRHSSLQLTEAPQYSTSPLLVFAERYFAFHDVLGRTACGEEPIFGTDFWSRSNNGDDRVIDPWLGCSPRLMHITSIITEMSWQNQAGTCPESILCPPLSGYRGLEDLVEDLANLQQIPSNTRSIFHLDESSPDEPLASSVAALAEAKRLAVEAYLHSALCGAGPTTPEVMMRVTQILRLVYVATTSGISTSAARLTWPIFVAAVLLDPFSELEWVDDAAGILEGLPRFARPCVLYYLEQQRGGLGNIDRVRLVIEQVWKAREKGGDAMHEPCRSNGPGSDWGRFVAPYCHFVSLA
jgi:hypothetical protein